MIPTPALGVRFHIDRLGGGAYGLEAWKIFWQAVSPPVIAGGFLYEGDSSATLSGSERVFVIVVHHQDVTTLQRVAAALNASTAYQGVAASPDLSWNESVAAEPLPEAGRIDGLGGLVGGFWARSALQPAKHNEAQVPEATTEPRNIATGTCPNCGVAFVPGDTFCGECGTRLAVDPSGDPAILPAPLPARGGRPPTWLWVVVGSIVLLLIAGIGVFVLTRDSGDERASVAQRSGGSGVPAGPIGQIAFRSNRNDGGDIYTMNVDGSGLTQVTEHPDSESFPSWSPDGKKIAFSRLNAPNVSVCLPNCTSDIYVIDADGQNEVRLTNTPESEYDPAWSPDGKRIAFGSAGEGGSDIFVTNVDGSRRTQLTHNSAEDFSPDWSPDGKRLVFESGSGDTETPDLMVMNADGSGLRALAETAEAEFSPSWSPDGKKIAFARGDFNLATIYLMNSDGSNVKALEETRADGTGTPTWSPDAKWIMFRNDHGFFFVQADGGAGRLERVPGTLGQDTAPAWLRSR